MGIVLRGRMELNKLALVILAFIVVLLVSATDSQDVQGVVGSDAVLNCYNGTSEVETIQWEIKSTDESIIYFPIDRVYAPPDHNPRLSISQETQLIISPLDSTDSGTYICKITSPVLDHSPTYVVKLTVIDGCKVWNYTPPLKSESCSPGYMADYQTQCNFSCTTGFLVGSNVSKCQSNGELTGSMPHCKERSCYIDGLPQNFLTEHGLCKNGMEMEYGESCAFQCDPGYTIEGINYISCAEGGRLSDPFPICKDASSGSNDKLLALLVLIPLIVIFVIVLVWWTKQKNNKHNQNGFEDTPQTQLLRKDIDEFPFLVNDQIKKLNEEEKRMVKLKIAKLIRGVEDQLLHKFPADKSIAADVCPEKPTPEEAFAWYIYMIVSFIPDDDEADEVKRNVITATYPMSTEEPKDYQSNFSFMKPHVMKTQDYQQYLEKIHVAFATLLAVERAAMMNEGDKRERTSKLSDFLSDFHKKKDEKKSSKDYEEKDIPSDWKSSLGSCGGERGNTYFAEMCVKSINRCHNLSNALKLRHNILKIMYSETSPGNSKF